MSHALFVESHHLHEKHDEDYYIEQSNGEPLTPGFKRYDSPQLFSVLPYSC
jgi:hypothetical protein